MPDQHHLATKRDAWLADPRLMLQELRANAVLAEVQPEVAILVPPAGWKLYADVLQAVIEGRSPRAEITSHAEWSAEEAEAFRRAFAATNPQPRPALSVVRECPAPRPFLGGVTFSE